MKKYGLIGKKLSHSFSKGYFTEKFEKLGLKNTSYEQFELKEIEEINSLFALEGLEGLNVTIPYKESVIPFLNALDQSAKRIGAVNVIQIKNNFKTGFNTDYYGFKNSLQNWINNKGIDKALVLGTGGASKAICCALEDLKITYKLVSRSPSRTQIGYEEANNLLDKYLLIINTTPLGMAPNTDTYPSISYSKLTQKHHLYDLVYNPLETQFLLNGKSQGSAIKNGLEMLHLQAEESWKIWNK